MRVWGGEGVEGGCGGMDVRMWGGEGVSYYGGRVIMGVVLFAARPGPK